MALRSLLVRVVRRLLRGGGPSSPREPYESPPAPPSGASPSQPADPPAREAKAWYLDGSTEGWDSTNPGTEPERRNLR